MKRKKLIFILTTSLLALMYMGGGTRYFVEFNEMSDIYIALQFPRWLHPVLGVTKFMAVISLITILFNIKFNPSWLKEWTYAGIFFNGTLALMAHQMVNEPFVLSIPVLCMARCGKSAMIFRRNRKIANCNEFRLGIQPQ